MGNAGGVFQVGEAVSWDDRIEIGAIVGEVLTHIDTNESNDEILLTTRSGKTIKIFHQQDCCENVRIEGTDGNWHDIVGKVIIEASKSEFDECEPKPSEWAESWTRTELKFRSDAATVISRWIGESNGYYSEGVDIADVTNAFAKVKP